MVTATNGCGGAFRTRTAAMIGSADKALLRKSLRDLRRAAARDLPRAAEDAAAHFLKQFPADPAASVAGYLAQGSELSTLPLLQALAGLGVPLALPVVTAPAAALEFRAWRPGQPLSPDAMGIPAPLTAAPVRPRVVLVPLIGFDALGGRLGQGGGFYDRSLAALRASGAVTAIGYAFACQQVPGGVPCEAHDCRLDAIVTETGVITRPAAAGLSSGG